MNFKKTIDTKRHMCYTCIVERYKNISFCKLKSRKTLFGVSFFVGKNGKTYCMHEKKRGGAWQ